MANIENHYYKVEYTKFEINTASGDTVKIDNTILGSLELFESLDQPGITGNISLLDFAGIIEVYNVTAGDTLTFKFKSPGETGSVGGTYIITGVVLNQFPEHDYLSVYTRLEFCSQWFLDARVTQYSNLWKNKSLDEIATDVIEFCGGTIGTIEPSTITLEHFGTPYWTPLHILYYLLGFYGEGMTMFPDIKTDKVNIMSLNSIFSGDVGTYPYKFLTMPTNTNYEALVFQMTLEECADFTKYLSNGLAGIVPNTFNFDTGQFQTPNPNTLPTTVNFNHFAKYSQITQNYNTPKYYNNEQLSIFPQSKTSVSLTQLNSIVSNIQKTQYIRLFGDAVKLNIIAVGSSARKVGQICSVDVPSLNDNKSKPNKVFSGQWVISHIKRIFTGSNYKEMIGLINTGTMTSINPNLVKW